MHTLIKICLFLCSLSIFQLFCSATVACRQRRDDADKVIVTTIEEPPYVTRNEARGVTGNKAFKGLIPDMMAIISDKMKLDYELRIVSDGKYGGPREDGTWSGMIGEILDGDADIAAAPITISKEREQVVDFTEPFETFGTVMLMLEGQENPSTTGISSIKDLADREDISYGIIRDGVTEEFFKNSNDETYQKMWEYLKTQQVASVEEGVNNVRNGKGKYVFILENATAEYWVDMKPCNLKIVGEKINEKSFGFALKKGINRKERMDEAIKEMKKEGKINELRQKWKRGGCGKTIEVETSSASKFSTPAGVLSVIVYMTWQLFAL